MTVTDEDKALFVALMGYDSETIDAILGGNAFTWEVEQIAAYRQAAYAAGLERAAVILEEDAKLCDCFARAEGECACGAWDDYKTAPIERMVDLIRAEKDKT